MANFGDFSSLFQLGVGIGIGLSLFRAPVDLRVNKIARTIEYDLVALRGGQSPFAKTKRRDLLDLMLRFKSAQTALNRWQLPFMFAAVLAAALNLLGLVAATLYSSRIATSFEVSIFIFLSIGWYIVELLLLEILARWNLNSIAKELSSIRTRNAPAIQI